MSVAVATQTPLSCAKSDDLLPWSLLYNIVSSKLTEAFHLSKTHADLQYYRDDLYQVKDEPFDIAYERDHENELSLNIRKGSLSSEQDNELSQNTRRGSISIGHDNELSQNTKRGSVSSSSSCSNSQPRLSKRQRTNSSSRECLESVSLVSKLELKNYCKHCNTNFMTKQELTYHMSLCSSSSNYKAGENKSKKLSKENPPQIEKLHNSSTIPIGNSWSSNIVNKPAGENPSDKTKNTAGTSGHESSEFNCRKRPVRAAALRNVHVNTSSSQKAAKILQRVKKSKKEKRKAKPIIKKDEVRTKKFQCSFCRCTFTSSWSKRRHEYRTHGEGVPMTSSDITEKQNSGVCLKCQQHPFPDKDPGIVGYATSWLCGVCGKVFSSRSILFEHIKVHNYDFTKNKTGVPFKCYVCNEVLKSYNSLLIHNQSHLSKCNSCGTFFLTDEMEKHHKCKKHTDVEIKCKECNKTFKTMPSFKKHQKQNHTALKNALQNSFCKLCEFTFSSVLIYKVHKSIAHPTLSGGNDLKCEICSLEFGDKRQLANHVMIKHKTLPFICTVCEKGFAKFDDLTQHKTSHFVL